MPRRKKEEELLLSDKDRVPRGAANARERTRMRILSRAFGRLKLTLPWVPPDTKLSKLDTLRLATSYISHLQRILADEEDGGETGGGGAAADSDRVVNLRCWPYGHHRLNNPTPLRTVVQQNQQQEEPLGDPDIKVEGESAEVHQEEAQTQKFLAEYCDKQYYAPASASSAGTGDGCGGANYYDLMENSAVAAEHQYNN